jgi:uncharacterized membrane protein
VKGIIQFIKTALVGGFFVVLPIVLLYLLLGEVFDLAIALGTPISDLLPEEAFGGAETEKAVAMILLLLICFLTGLAMKTRTGNRIGKWFEQSLLEPIPGYAVIRDLSQRLAGEDSIGFYHPAIVRTSADVRTPAFIVEEHSSGDYTVLIPIAPTPGLGTIQVVRRHLVEKVEAPLPEVLECYWHWGVGTEKMMSRLKKE